MIKKEFFIRVFFVMLFVVIYSWQVFSSANILVNYVNTPYGSWTPQAKSAFQYAIDIWSQTITSTQTIVIEAKFEDLVLANNGNQFFKFVLGYARASTYVKGFSSSDARYDPYYFYPLALAEKLANQNIGNFNSEILITINSNTSISWFYGTSGSVPQNSYDMVTTVLHEICHGLGFASSAIYTDMFSPGQYYAGFTDLYIYDKFIQNSNGKKPIDFLIPIVNNFNSNSTAYLTSNDLYFSGSQATLSNQNQSPALFAPATWQGGSSISHFDEYNWATTPNSGNHLMTPATNSGEKHHNPGYVGLGLLQDIGWDGTLYLMSVSENHLVERANVLIYPNPTRGHLNIRTQNGNKISKVRVSTFSGQLLFLKYEDSENSMVDFGVLHSGPYLLEVELENGTYYREIVIKKE